MSTVIVVVIVIIVILAVGAAGFLVFTQGRSKRLRAKFGPEYDRAVQSHESAREAEQELLARQKRHDKLDIKDLAPETRERLRGEWRRVQERFVDAPASAVIEAHRLLVLVIGERGYPTESFEQQAEDLSVEHAGTIERYRAAHEIGTRAETEQASTEDLRQAMVHYRALFTELLGETRTEQHDGATARTDGTHANGTDSGDGRAETSADAEKAGRHGENAADHGTNTEADHEAGAAADRGTGAAPGRDVDAEGNGRGARDRAGSGTQTGEHAGRRDDAGDEGV